MKNWIYNEFRQTGVDFERENEVNEYDEKYKSLRNYDEEVRFISEAMKLSPASVVLELGTGTGEHAMRLAPLCRKVTACDISIPMLNCAEKKASELGIENIEFVNTGFLSMQFAESSFDAAISQLALHHLPDFWKSVALINISRVLKSGGVLYLLDSILCFEPSGYEKAITGVLEFAGSRMGERIAEEIIVNIRDEYPTYDWIIENLLLKSGFSIDKKIKYTDTMALFVALKK